MMEFKHQFPEGSDPTLEQDRANNPGRTTKDVSHARFLWSADTIEIKKLTNDDNGDGPPGSRFISRKLLCSVSGRARKWLPAKRSWPILTWDQLIDKHWNWAFWTIIDGFLDFCHNGTPTDLNETCPEMYWCLGMALECPKLQNIAMRALLKRDSAFAQKLDHSACSPECLIMDRQIIMLRSREHIMDTGVTHDAEGDYTKHKLMAYMIDGMIWEGIVGGKSWLEIVHRGTCIASMVAHAMYNSASRPPPTFAPWHIFNHHRYFVDES